MITGIVVKNMNGYFYVQDDTSTIHECKVRGRLKQGLDSVDRLEYLGYLITILGQTLHGC